MQEVLHQLLLVVGSWEGTGTKCLGVTQSLWQWQLRGAGGGGVVFPGEREQQPMVLGCNALLFSFLATPVVTGVTGGAHTQASVVASHAFLWPVRRLPLSVPATCRSCKRHHVTLRP